LQRGVLALCLTAGLLCGCGGGSNAVTGSPSSPATSAQSSDSAADQSMAEKTVGRLSDLTSRWQVLLPRDDPIVAAEMACVRSVGRGGLTAEHAGDLFSSGDPTVLVGGKPFSNLPKVVTSSVWVYDTREDAASAFTTAEGFVRSWSAAQCLMRAMQTSNGPRVLSARGFVLRPDGLPAGNDRVSGTNWQVRLPGKVTVFVDTVLILQERGVGEAVLSSVSVPPFYGPLTSDDSVSGAVWSPIGSPTDGDPPEGLKTSPGRGAAAPATGR
jgi:hypothetical protein